MHMHSTTQYTHTTHYTHNRHPQELEHHVKEEEENCLPQFAERVSDQACVWHLCWADAEVRDNKQMPLCII